MRWVLPAFILIFLMVPACHASNPSEAATYSTLAVFPYYIPPPPPPPPPPPYFYPMRPPRGDIMAYAKVTLMKVSYSPGETLQAIVDIINTEFTMNDVILRASIGNETIYTIVEITTTIYPELNQRMFELKVPEVPGRYILRIEMIELNGDVTWTSAPFEVVKPVPIPWDWILALTFVGVVIVIVRKDLLS
jgi:hypothetical protein